MSKVVSDPADQIKQLEEQLKQLKTRKSLLTNRQRLAYAYFTHLHFNNQRLVYWRDKWWGWTGRYYAQIDRLMLEAKLRRWLDAEFAKAETPPNITNSLVADVLGGFVSHCAADSLQDAPFSLVHNAGRAGHYISLENGVLNVEMAADSADLALSPHDPEWFTTGALPFSYDPAATCPRWDKFLAETFEGDPERIQFIEEWMGYCCVYDYSYQQCVILTGRGANGKGVLTKVMVALIGPENCSHVPLESFGERFALEGTVGKLLNSAPEISALDKNAEESLKAVTGADRVGVTRKYRDTLFTHMTARLMFSTNAVPLFEDGSDGLRRRLIIVPFNHQVPQAQWDPQLPDKLYRELPGIFNRALAGLARLRARGSFAIPAASIAFLDRHMLESDPIKMFLDECTSADSSVATGTLDLYKAYQTWHDEQGFMRAQRPSQPTFAKAVEERYLIRGELRRALGTRVRYYNGIRGPEGCLTITNG